MTFLTWLVVPAACAVLALLRLWRIWLFYYIAGAAGFTILSVGLLHATAVEYWLEGTTGAAAHLVAGTLGIPTRLFRNAPGSLLVLIVGQSVGWTVVQITLECSALLEMSVFGGLVLFLPAMPWWQRLWNLTWGEAFTFAANLARVLLIILALHLGGKNWIYISHTVLARLFFFALTMWLYWTVFTRHALATSYRMIRLAAAASGGIGHEHR